LPVEGEKDAVNSDGAQRAEQVGGFKVESCIHGTACQFPALALKLDG
jgi:hypothetical protein